MTTKDIALYSWRNNTENISYILEFKDLLNEQRKRGDICTCIVSNNIAHTRGFKQADKYLENIQLI